MACYFGTNVRWYPAYGPNAVTFPLVYDESMSIVQQIAYLYGAWQEVAEREGSWLPIATFEEFLAALSEDQAEQTTALQRYAGAGDAATLARAKALIDKMELTGLVYDPSQGTMATGVDAMRNAYRWLAVHALTVAQLAESVATVADLAASTLNVRGLATWSAELMPGWTEPDGIRVP